ncbi:collagen-binding domain-containing protein [Roseivirga ehrenbergii]|uniref:collagen-binding domain-containing protein n=1 Tax=Roseivirga ehrenbergii (strain DSM 102268 / JCM 13514 / KCTC 12282 / NCIMB 14502 / KMM 6017) TaxID=279360 RepID=UPI001C884EDF|nr:collagen-binding domain-containing protein [Roseivirga ehrenbergii]
MTVDKTSFDCNDLGNKTVTLTGTDASGNSASATATVTVIDNIAPVITVNNNITVEVDENGSATITQSQVVTSVGDDNCGSVNITISKTSFDCTDLGTNTITVTATDASGNVTTKTVTVTVVDSSAPVFTNPTSGSVISQNPTAPAMDFNVFVRNNVSFKNNETEGAVALGGDLSIDGSYQVSTNSTGSFKVNNVPVTLVVGGKVNYNSGNSLQVNQNGYVKIGNANGSKVWYQDQNGANSPIRITKDNNYNSSPRLHLQANAQQLGVNASNNPIFESNVIDFEAAFAQMEASALSMSQLANNANLTNPNGQPISNTNLPNQVKINLQDGLNVLNVTGSDLNNVSVFTFNNQPSQSKILIINVDNPGTFNWNVYNTGGIGEHVSPYILYNFYNSTTVKIQGNGSIIGTVFAPFAFINKTSHNNISGQVIGKSFTQLSGENHMFGFSGTITSGTTTEIEEGSTVVRNADDCTYEVQGPEFTPAVTDNGCADVSLTYALSGATTGSGTDLSGVSLNVGQTVITWTATDGSNTTTFSITVDVEDNTAPTVLAKNITVALDANGNANITAAQVDNGSSDNCNLTLSIDKLSFDCNDIGTQTVTLTGTDANGNATMATATVTVVDNIAPTIVADNITIEINENGSASLTQEQLITSITSNNCGDVTLSISKTSFDCTNLGQNVVTITATDSHGNSSNTSITVTVIDNVAPVWIGPGVGGSSSAAMNPTAPAMDFNIFIKNNLTLKQNEAEGAVALGGDLTHNGYFQVSTNSLGSFKVNNVPVSLLVGGKVNYSGGYSLKVNQYGYIKIGNANGSKVWYQDRNNAYSPIRITKDNNYYSSPLIELQANAQQLGVSASNNPVFESGLIDFNEAFAQLETNSLALSQLENNADLTNANGQSISNTNLPNQVKINLHDGVNVLNLTGDDLNRVSTFTFNNQPNQDRILVINVNSPGSLNWNVYNSAGIGENVAPYIIYNFYNTTFLQVQGNGSVIGSLLAPYAEINKTSWNNISGQIIAKSMTQHGGETHMFAFAGTIGSQNNSSTETIEDGETVSRNTEDCAYTVAGNEFTPSIGDNSCANLYLSYALSGATTGSGTDLSGVSLNVGQTVITWTATDGSNTTTFSITVDVEDNTAPTVLAKDITVALDANGNANITAAQVDNGSSDNCNLTLSVDKTSFNCSDLGTQTVTLTGTDANGNSATATTIVTVVDNTAPNVITQDISVSLNASGNAIITAAQINNGSSDNCGIESITVSKTSFDCSNLGDNTVTLTVTDNNGNTSTKTATVTIVDNIAPVFTSAPTNKVYQAENGNCNLQAYWTVPVVSDNCNVTLTSTHNPGDVFPVGTTTVTYTATDAGGNSVSTSFNVTVQASPMNVVLQADTYTTASGIYNTTCSGAEDGKVMLAVTGGCGPYTYLWSNGSTSKDLNGVEAGTYSVTVTDNNGTQIQKSITLTSPTAIEVEKVVTTEQTLTGYGDANTIYLGFGEQTAVLQANATGGSGDYTYTWSPNEEIACSFENTVTVAPQVTTTYTVVVTDSNGCSTTESFTINVIDVRCDDYNAPGGSNGGGNDDDDDDNNGGGDNGEVFDCQCEGKMKNFTVVYNGFSGVTIKAYKKDKKTVIKTFNNVQNGEEIQVTGFDHKGRLDSKTYLEIGSAKYEIHTSCSINIMGETYGPFTVIEFTDGDGATCSGNGTPSTANFTGSVAPIVSHSGGYTYGDDDDDDNYRDDDDDDNYRDDDDDDNHTHNSTCGHDDDDDNGSTPGSDCQCEGRMENFTVVYQGQSGKTVKAYNKKMDYLIETYYNVQYGDTLVVEGFDKHDRLESKTMLMVDWTSYEVHTSCSINILGSEIGPFKVVAYTDGEGFTCSLPSEDGNNDGGGNSSGCNVDTINWTGNVTICYNGQTYCVTQEEAENYLALGASLGSCSFNITASSKGIAAKATGENTDINTEIKFEVSTYPNPASDLANITFNVNQDGPVTVAIFDTKGLQVGNTLFEENAEIDRKYTVVFDASSVKEGIYIIRLRTAGYIESKKLMIKK